MQKQVQYIIKGMNRDMTVSKFPADHSFENKNIRITQTAGQTLLSITNEKGPSEIELLWDPDIIYTDTDIQQDVSGDCVITGKILGHCAIDKYLVLFVRRRLTNPPSPSYTDTIYRIEVKTGKVVVLVSSFEDTGGSLFATPAKLNFGDNVQALGLYENDTIIKVYFVDGRNQNRFINIVDPIRLKYDESTAKYTNSFTVNDVNFMPQMSFDEKINIERVDSSNGVFAPGAIQYVFTYYNLYGQETAVFYQSELFYTSYEDRGGKEDDTVSNAFKISIYYENSIPKFDYVRIYSLLRTSVNADPQCNIVADLNLKDLVIDPNDATKSTITFIDNGTTGEAYDPKALMLLNGELFSSKTLAAKDNTLFTGNLNILIPRISNTVKDFFKNAVGKTHSASITSVTLSFEYDYTKNYDVGDIAGSYPYNIHLDKGQTEITTFKYLETYRFGIQFLHRSGKWSDPVFLADIVNNKKPSTAVPESANCYTSTTDAKNTYLAQGQISINPGTDFSPIKEELVNNGFIKVRPVVVYPELWDRSVLAQGIVCPTVYNVEDRNSNRPFAYSSWYARPNAGARSSDTNTLGARVGVFNEYKHNEQIPNNTSLNAEIQCITETNQHPFNNTSVYDNVQERDTWVQTHKENFFIDKSIITFHSPEIELSDNLDVLDLSQVRFRIIGIVPLTGFDSDIYISTSTVGNVTLNEKLSVTDSNKSEDEGTGKPLIGPGFYDEQVKVNNISTDGWRCRMGNINWIDEETHYRAKHVTKNHNHPKVAKWFGFFIYPWHRSKSLNNTVTPNENGWESALLENKIHTNARYSYNSFYFPNGYFWEPVNKVSGIKLANVEPQSEESEVSLIKLPSPKNSELGELNYYGSVDKIVVIANEGSKMGGYPIVIAASSRSTDANKEWRSGHNGPRAATNHELFTGQYDSRCSNAVDPPYYAAVVAHHAPGTLMEYIPEGFVEDAEEHWNEEDQVTWSDYVNGTVRRVYWQVSTFDPIRIRYKSTKHAVMAFNYASPHTQIILPKLNGETSEADNISSKKYFWEVGKDVYANAITQTSLTSAQAGLSNCAFGYLFLGELYRDTIDNRFGGNTEEAYENNTWVPAGEPVELIDNNLMTLIADRGDTFYQRYDCLKTYPFTPDEKNSIIENVSFMCETRINCDGRYDKNRGNATKFTITPKNFNLMNPVYNQKNNYFNYSYLNSNRVYPDHFNQVCWSMTKSLGEDIDTWAKINLGSTLDMDGEYGEIVALVFFNNDIWCFQERGISKILFNSRVQIPVSDGVPIEITNGMKVQGKVYITTKAGCQNKFAITTTPNGVYFIDGYNNTITIFNGQALQNVSDIKGFREWMYTQDTVTEWKNNPGREIADGYKLFYDSAAQDIYFVNEGQCLVFSELLGEFTSFYDYNDTSVMDIVQGKFYAATDFENYNDHPINKRIRLWGMFDGEYNMFYKPADVPDTQGSGDNITYPWKAYYKPFYVQYNVNPDPTLDKTFDNVEFRSDSWNEGSLVTYPDSDGVNKTFDTLEAENEYQYGSMALSFSHAQYSQDSTLKRKFRVWRTIMPRETGTRNRIRNTWCKVKLSWNTPNRYKTILHDTVIKYFI